MTRFFGVKVISSDTIDTPKWQFKLPPVTGEPLLWFNNEDAAMKYGKEQCGSYEAKDSAYTVPAVVIMYSIATMKDYPMEAYKFMPIQNAPEGCVGTLPLPSRTSPVEYNGRAETWIVSSLGAYIPADHPITDDKYYSNIPLTHLNQVMEVYHRGFHIELPDNYQTTLVDTGTNQDGNPNVFYRHYGAKSFDPGKMTPVSCRPSDLKPAGGFWASREECQSSWSDFCRREEYQSYDRNNFTAFTITSDAKVLEIRTYDDIKFLMKNYPAPMTTAQMVDAWDGHSLDQLPLVGIDYTKVSIDYDGIEYFYSQLGNVLGPFDCDSIVVWNPDAIEPIQLEIEEPDWSGCLDENLSAMEKERFAYFCRQYCTKNLDTGAEYSDDDIFQAVIYAAGKMQETADPNNPYEKAYYALLQDSIEHATDITREEPDGLDY